MGRHGQEIATCPCGRKYYVYSMTVVDQHLCPICREEEVEAAERTEREVAERAKRKRKSIDELIEEAGLKKKRPGRYGQEIFFDEASKYRKDNNLHCCVC